MTAHVATPARNTLTDGSETFDIVIRDGAGGPEVFRMEAINELGAYAVLDALAKHTLIEVKEF